MGQLMMKRRRTLWYTKFGRLVRQRTVDGLISELRQSKVFVTRQAVYGWVYGRRRPSLEAQDALLLRIAPGELTLNDLQRHRQLAKAQPAKPRRFPFDTENDGNDER